jgi:uncharacterized protein with NAD-binding domain and iron-sulfur cluster
VTLVDGAETPGGLSAGWRTPKGRAVEAGIKGFWYQVYTSSVSSPFSHHSKLNLKWLQPSTHKGQKSTPCSTSQVRLWAEVFAYLQYHNIFRLVKELDIEWPFTGWTTSGFWSPSGLTTQAPVFSSLPRFPALVGQFVHTAPLFW